MKPDNFITRRDYLVEDVARTGNFWVVEARYWGSPDDWHRRPFKVVCKILASDSNTIQDVVEEVPLRPDGHREMEAQKSARCASSRVLLGHTLEPEKRSEMTPAEARRRRG